MTVFALQHGKLLVWVKDGRAWTCERLPGAVPRFTPWVELGERTLPEFGGFILSKAEVAQLTPPPNTNMQEEQTHG